MNVRSALVFAAGVVLAVSGCATNQGEQSGMHRDTSHGHARMAQMCEMHKQTTEGKSPAEQRAAAEAHVKAMHGSATPEMVAHHIKLMEMHCGHRAAAPADSSDDSAS